MLHPSTLSLIAHVLVFVVLTIRVIMQRPPTGAALAWALLIVVAPVVGPLIYLVVGERRISSGRVRGFQTLRSDFRRIAEAAVKEGLTQVDWSRHPAAARSMDRLGLAMVGSQTVRGSRLGLCDEADDILASIARDVDAATRSVLMEFYIWHQGGAADEVLEAVIRAARRGVSCRILIDAIGARPWWKGEQPQRLRDAGVELCPALPVGLFRTLVGRTDLRLHRKTVVVDGRVAWTGSMNLVDPRYFKQDAGVGPWVDAMVRVEGAAVVPLAATAIGDWTLETGASLEQCIGEAGLGLTEPVGNADIQVIPAGPGETRDGLLQMMLALIHAARDELTLTTPYLVPDDSLLRALRGAAGRGVRVRLILPEKVDSFLTRYASRSYYDDLLDVGVEIHLYRDGLLHTKSIMADRSISMFGTVNLDMRSFWLNYELALFVYDREFAGDLQRLQQSYLEKSEPLRWEQWQRRPFRIRLLENTVRLFSPLL